MPEIPDVVFAEEIEVSWGNLIRSRTVQRYPDVAGRSSEHPSPAQGDLAYMENTDAVYVYDGASWLPMVIPLSIKSQEDTDTNAINNLSAITSRASLTFSKPSHWNTYEIMAWGSALFQAGAADSTGVAWIRINGTVQMSQHGNLDSGDVFVVPLLGFATGLSAASPVIDIQVNKAAGTIHYSQSHLLIRAQQLT